MHLSLTPAFLVLEEAIVTRMLTKAVLTHNGGAATIKLLLIRGVVKRAVGLRMSAVLVYFTIVILRL